MGFYKISISVSFYKPIYVMCMGVCLHVCLCSTCMPSVHRSQKRALLGLRDTEVPTNISKGTLVSSRSTSHLYPSQGRGFHFPSPSQIPIQFSHFG